MRMKDWPKDSPWATKEECMKELTAEWQRIKERGVKAGVLTPAKDGTLRLNCNPEKLFDLED